MTKPEGVDYIVFSDSIVITAIGETEQAFISVARSCSQLMHALLNQGIPIRGAIAYGAFFRSAVAKSAFVAGRAVIDAYTFEQAQDWVGVMIAPSALRRIPDADSRCSLSGCSNSERFKELLERIEWPAFIHRCQSIPFHSTATLNPQYFDGYAVVPTAGVMEPAAIRDAIGTAIERLDWLRSIAPSPQAQRKYQETIKWLGLVQSDWHNLSLMLIRR